MKFTILTILKCIVSGVEHMHIVVHPSHPRSELFYLSHENLCLRWTPQPCPLHPPACGDHCPTLCLYEFDFQVLHPCGIQYSSFVTGSFMQHHVSSSLILWYGLCQHCPCLSRVEKHSTLSLYRIVIVCSLADGHLGCFYCLALWIMLLPELICGYLLTLCFHFFWIYFPEVGFLDYTVILFYFWGTSILFATRLHHFIFPPAVHKGSISSQLLITLLVFCIFL